MRSSAAAGGHSKKAGDVEEGLMYHNAPVQLPPLDPQRLIGRKVQIVPATAEEMGFADLNQEVMAQEAPPLGQEGEGTKEGTRENNPKDVALTTP